MTEHTRLLLVDDHAVVREGYRRLLETRPDLQIVAEAASAREAQAQFRDHAPDVVVLDLRMPNVDGVEAARRIGRDLPGTAVLVLTMFDEDDLVADALAAGARGYLLKGEAGDELLRAIRTVCEGRSYLCPEVAATVADALRDRPGVYAAAPRLTARERQVLRLIAEGLTSVQIGDRLHIAASTVEVHRRNLMRKLDLHNVAELTRYAIHSGISPSTNAGSAG